MKEAKLKNYLEVATNAAVLLVALVVLSAFAWTYFIQKPKLQLELGTQKGQTVAQLPTISYGNSPQTLIIAMSTKCSYCSESVPFYQQLTKKQHEDGTATRIIAIFPEMQDEVNQYIQQNQLGMTTVASVDFKPFNIGGTPTMILVDNSGKVLDFWVGRLSKDDEQQVVKAISLAKT
jgi:thioredoxin-related protein